MEPLQPRPPVPLPVEGPPPRLRDTIKPSGREIDRGGALVTVLGLVAALGASILADPELIETILRALGTPERYVTVALAIVPAVYAAITKQKR